ncbi:plasmid stabilization protein [Rubrivivax gelatinosus]|uniref:type II toxin-antitoxin system RelE/ParE family toxin n=1 Tax=Rubrivivax gelatinosus TaxID=28068 RepID=UPI001902CC04|nr:plasmid stabilization protein [Rubrivivax gelatinosus]MBZ8142927.1 plasmid stabilization protein [Rubrivivax gelatinosus]
MSFRVAFSQTAKDDLGRLYDHLLERAEYLEDLDLAERAVEAILNAATALASTPFLFRKVAGPGRALRRELVVPFGAAGYVLQYEIAGPELVVVLAVRHQREEDRH